MMIIPPFELKRTKPTPCKMRGARDDDDDDDGGFI